jgi:hypothetical protein
VPVFSSIWFMRFCVHTHTHALSHAHTQKHTHIHTHTPHALTPSPPPHFLPLFPPRFLPLFLSPFNTKTAPRGIMPTPDLAGTTCMYKKNGTSELAGTTHMYIKQISIEKKNKRLSWQVRVACKNVCTSIHAYIHSHTHKQIYMYSSFYTYVCIHSYIHTYTRIDTSSDQAIPTPHAVMFENPRFPLFPSIPPPQPPPPSLPLRWPAERSLYVHRPVLQHFIASPSERQRRSSDLFRSYACLPPPPVFSLSPNLLTPPPFR